MRREPFQRALVTGAAGGLGSALCRRLAGDGTDLVLLDRDADGLERLRAELGGRVRVSTTVVDLVDHASFATALRELLDEGVPDLVVANAGVDRPQPLASFDWRMALDDFAVNATANVVLLAEVVPHLLRRGGGHVVAVASLAGLAGFPVEATYCASKAALAVFVESARAELAPRGVSFTTAWPGFVETPMLAGNAWKVSSPVPVGEAAARIHRAARARRARVAFPRSVLWKTRLGTLLPVRLRDRALRAVMDPTRLGGG
ncbi:MAG: SDR family oxidoreductase [Acidimicrobiia bacterium]|nr:SDR family oxidoreductase [Acidimicrobiia bacterium]